MDEAFIALIVIFLAGCGLIDICFEVANLITKIIKRKEKKREMNFNFEQDKDKFNKALQESGIEIISIMDPFKGNEYRVNTKEHDKQVQLDIINDAIHCLDNSKVTCHEDYVDGLDFAMGVLEGIKEELCLNSFYANEV